MERVSRPLLSWGLDIYRRLHREIFAPKGLEDSGQGFNPGNRSPQSDAPERAPDRTYYQGGRRVQRSNCSTSQLRTLTFCGNRCEVHLIALAPSGRTVYFASSQG